VSLDDPPDVEQELLSIIRIVEWLAHSSDWRMANRRQEELLAKWKAVFPRLRDRRRGEELWKRFDAARERYYDRRKAHFAEVERRREHPRARTQRPRKGPS
jgi:Domain of Unknown Function (DUF349)